MAEYEWDETKSRENLARHGISFHDAEAVFAGSCVTSEDTRRDYGEPRFITIGLLRGRTVVIAHTPRGGRTRVISMRKANSRETRRCRERLEAR